MYTTMYTTPYNCEPGLCRIGLGVAANLEKYRPTTLVPKLRLRRWVRNVERRFMMRVNSYGLRTVSVLVSIVFINVFAIGQTPAKNLKNPVATDAESIGAGQKLYEKACKMCHGQTGKGDGPIVKTLKPEATKPSILVDDKWDHGSTDGEMFVAIRDGIGPKFEMKGQKGKISDQEIWHLVNYVRSLAAKK